VEWVVTDNIYDETWRRLLEYANSDLAVAEIVRRHGPAATKRDEANYRKQARQIRVSVLQAKEYFDAARSSSIVTSPNHVYYGCVALASMMMLLMSDGTRSLDWLRQDSKNAHHGLTFTTGCGEGRAAVGFELVQNSWVEILLNGHFGNWYSSLPRFVDAHALVTRHLDGATIQSFQSVGRAAVPALSEIAGKKYSVMDCMKALPDLVTTLGRYGVELDTSRTTYTIDVLHNGSQKHVWALHGAQTAMALERVMAEFATKPEFADCFGVTGEATGVGAVHGALISFDYAAGGGATFKWPNTRVGKRSAGDRGLLPHRLSAKHVVAILSGYLDRVLRESVQGGEVD
jgi:hypothetical protein